MIPQQKYEEGAPHTTNVRPPIEVTDHPTLGPSVSGRALYPLITNSKSVRDIFSDWFRRCEKRFSLVQGKDFIATTVYLPHSDSNRPHYEFIVALPAAMILAEKAALKRGLPVLHYLRSYGKPAKENTFAQADLPFTTASQPAQPVVHGLDAINALSVLPGAMENLSIVPIGETPIQKLLREVQDLAKQEEAQGGHFANPSRLDQLEQRLNDYAGKFDALILFFQQAAVTLKGFTPAGIEPISTRAKVVRLVEVYAASKRVEHSQVWRFLYGQLNTRYRFDVFALNEGKKDPSYLDTVEASGMMDSLHTIARATLTAVPTPVTQQP